MITLIGFIVATTPFILLFVNYGTQFKNEAGIEVPNWFFFYQGISYFAYRMLDEMDGKQARKTGNSSPLGLIFDHGCDAFTIGTQALLFVKFCQAGDPMWSCSCIVAVLASFYFSTLEEYYTGGLFLGLGNFITDGSVVVIGLYIVMGIWGNNFWI